MIFNFTCQLEGEGEKASNAEMVTGFKKKQAHVIHAFIVISDSLWSNIMMDSSCRLSLANKERAVQRGSLDHDLKISHPDPSLTNVRVTKSFPLESTPKEIYLSN